MFGALQMSGAHQASCAGLAARHDMLANGCGSPWQTHVRLCTFEPVFLVVSKDVLGNLRSNCCVRPSTSVPSHPGACLHHCCQADISLQWPLRFGVPYALTHRNRRWDGITAPRAHACPCARSYSANVERLYRSAAIYFDRGACTCMTLSP